MVGGDDAGFLAAAMLASQSIYGASLFSSSRFHFRCFLLPVMLVVLCVPFFNGAGLGSIIVVCLCVIHNFLGAVSASRNRNQAVAELFRSQSAAEAARHESLAKSQFIATMSHELRTPLNAVIGYAEILQEDLKAEGLHDSAEDAARIRKSARNLLGLINDILDYSKIEAGRMDVNAAPVDIRDLVQDAVHTVAHLTATSGTEVVIEIDDDAANVMTDGARLRQCLLNLLSNAAKFTEDGCIEVRATMENRRGGAYLRIDVADTGCGISESDADRLFQPFSQVDGSLTRQNGGTGLGLMITKRLCELLGGDVSFISAENAGSTFTLRIRDYARSAHAVGEGPVVLMIEDESSARDLMYRALSRLPFEVLEAENAERGMACARAGKPSLILLDLHLPDRSGWDLLAELKSDEALRHVPVLVVSTDDDRARALALGACEHLVKPVDKERIAAAVMRFALRDAQRLEASEQRTALAS
jgi:signal transduction histidine kinase/CheY-like chemotaxis protein